MYYIGPEEPFCIEWIEFQTCFFKKGDIVLLNVHPLKAHISLIAIHCNNVFKPLIKIEFF